MLGEFKELTDDLPNISSIAKIDREISQVKSKKLRIILLYISSKHDLRSQRLFRPRIDLR